MDKWYCYKCNEEVQEVSDIALIYKDVELPQVEGYRCPKCGIEFLKEDIVVFQLNPAEEMLEGK